MLDIVGNVQAFRLYADMNLKLLTNHFLVLKTTLMIQLLSPLNLQGYATVKAKSLFQ